MGCCPLKKYEQQQQRSQGQSNSQNPSGRMSEQQLQKFQAESINPFRPSALHQRIQKEIILSKVLKQTGGKKLYSEQQVYKEQIEIDRQVYEQQSIGSSQDMKLFSSKDFQKYPCHQCIGALLSYSQFDSQQQFKGTAALISPDLILTSSHNLYDKHSKADTVNHRFYLGLNGSLKKNKYYEIQKFCYPEDYQYSKAVEHDYAIAKLKTKVTEIENPNFLNLALGFKDRDAKLYIYGYPSQDNYKKSGDERFAYQKGCSHKGFREIQHHKSRITYLVKTVKGQSGSPITTGKDRNLIVGVHKAGSKQKSEQYNMGRYMSIDMVLKMEIWRKSLDAQKFTVIDYNTKKVIDLEEDIYVGMMQMVKEEKLATNRIMAMVRQNIIESSKKNQKDKKDMLSKFQKQKQDLLKENYDLQQTNSKLSTQNQSLSQQLTQSKISLSETASKLEQLSEVSKNVKKKLSSFKKAIQNSMSEDQQQKSLASYIFQLEDCLKTEKQKEQEMNLYQNLQTSPIKKQSDYKMQWDPNCNYAKCFKIQQDDKLTYKNNDKCQIISKYCLPKVKTTIIRFRLEKYGNQMQICLGLLCTTFRKEAQLSGRHENSIGYFTQSSNDQGNKGYINADAQTICEWTQDLFVPQGGQLQMMVDLAKFQVTFTNKAQKSSKKLKLRKTYRQQQIFIFCNMYCIDDSVRIIN